MVKRFIPEKVIEEYQKDTQLANIEGRTLTTIIFWLAETMWCPNEEVNKEKFRKGLKQYLDIDVAEKDLKNICSLISCSICDSTGMIQRSMHPDFWEEVK